MEQVREENKQLLIARDNEIAAREGAEQKLAQVKSDLAKEMEDRQYYIVVCYVCVIQRQIYGRGTVRL